MRSQPLCELFRIPGCDAGDGLVTPEELHQVTARLLPDFQCGRFHILPVQHIAFQELTQYSSLRSVDQSDSRQFVFQLVADGGEPNGGCAFHGCSGDASVYQSFHMLTDALSSFLVTLPEIERSTFPIRVMELNRPCAIGSG
ncbi:MAG: hypothetical protein LC104_08475 [Bacteroidales bacterium]|nr:hypothetical protein [Bacteroidales bacterium]